MAILVDEARWPWRGTVWCHLVSDTSFAELHEFAGRLGCRRLGFQGDHYDIDVDTRIRAIELGANPTPSRDLVRAIRSAGLRRSPRTKIPWTLVERLGGDSVLERIERDVRLDGLGVEICLGRHADLIGGLWLERRGVADRPDVDAFMVNGGGGPPELVDNPSAGRHVRVDTVHGWSVELTSRPLLDDE